MTLARPQPKPKPSPNRKRALLADAGTRLSPIPEPLSFELVDTGAVEPTAIHEPVHTSALMGRVHEIAERARTTQARRVHRSGEGAPSGASAQVVDELGASIALRQGSGTPQQLPMWDMEQRGFPNPFARSALFTAVKDDDREYRKGTQVAALAGIAMVYTGEELRQDDASVLITILHFVRGTDLNQPLVTSKFRFLKELGWSINSREYAHLRACLTRIKATEIRLEADKGALGYAGSLLLRYEWADTAEGDTSLRLWVDPKIAKIYLRNAYTHLSWEQRKQIGHKAPLALWLHLFLSTHEKPFAISVAKYHELSGSRARSIADFRMRLKNALQKLVEIGFLLWFEIDKASDVVRLERRSLKAI
jgi:hypothetical protein